MTEHNEETHETTFNDLIRGTSTPSGSGRSDEFPRSNWSNSLKTDRTRRRPNGRLGGTSKASGTPQGPASTGCREKARGSGRTCFIQFRNRRSDR